MPAALTQQGGGIDGSDLELGGHRARRIHAVGEGHRGKSSSRKSEPARIA
jgi:hypothetical protein